MVAAVSGSQKNNMIVMELMGGLGNQMFQYALGKNLSDKYQTELKLDVSFYKKNYIKRNIKNIIKIILGLSTVKDIIQNKRGYDLKYFNLDDKSVFFISD